jgi:tetratricopeptide (TPR) repeat protein
MVVGSVVLGYLISLVPGQGISSSVVESNSVSADKTDDFSTLQARLHDDSPVNAQEQPAPEQSMSEQLGPKQPKPKKSVQAKQTLSPKEAEVQAVLTLAQAELDAERYDMAIAALQVAYPQLKQVPQAYLQMGQALQGKNELEIARDFYNKATDLDPFLAEAYRGFATTSEQLGDLEAAIGGMRNFLHVQPNADPQKLNIVQARSAIWEWESKLGRGPWGPTKGVPPDLTAEQIKRDGRGVATKVPILESKNADGHMKFTIKHGDKHEIFKQ